MASPSDQTPLSASTPSSQAATTIGVGSSSTTKAPKDKACPFCGQAFTSSSLGRHLDLYIKPKNPKPPDGVHDIEKIRMLRGGITRRQPRVSLKSRASGGGDGDSEMGTPGRGSISGPGAGYMEGTPSHTAAGAAGSGGNVARRSLDHRDAAMHSPVGVRDSQNMREKMVLNKLNWQATGVINNLPPRMADVGGAGAGNGVGHGHGQGGQMRREEKEADVAVRLIEEREIGKAAEMALREILGSLEAARYVPFVPPSLLLPLLFSLHSTHPHTNIQPAEPAQPKLPSSTSTSTATTSPRYASTSSPPHRPSSA